MQPVTLTAIEIAYRLLVLAVPTFTMVRLMCQRRDTDKCGSPYGNGSSCIVPGSFFLILITVGATRVLNGIIFAIVFIGPYASVGGMVPPVLDDFFSMMAGFIIVYPRMRNWSLSHPKS